MAIEIRIEPRHVAASLGLTPAEGRVAALLAEGFVVGDVAAALRITRPTVCRHLKHIYGKLDMSRQSQLVRAVLLSCAPPSARGDPVEPSEQLRAVQRSIGSLREAVDVHAAHLGTCTEQTRATLEALNVRLGVLENDIGIIKDCLVATMSGGAAPPS